MIAGHDTIISHIRARVRDKKRFSSLGPVVFNFLYYIVNERVFLKRKYLECIQHYRYANTLIPKQ